MEDAGLPLQRVQTLAQRGHALGRLFGRHAFSSQHFAVNLVLFGIVSRLQVSRSLGLLVEELLLLAFRLGQGRPQLLEADPVVLGPIAVAGPHVLPGLGAKIRQGPSVGLDKLAERAAAVGAAAHVGPLLRGVAEE